MIFLKPKTPPPATHECPQKNFSSIGPAGWPGPVYFYIYICMPSFLI